MTTSDITTLRLSNQRITHHNFKTPAQVVRWLGAVQAQDYAGSKWAIALRLPHATEEDIEAALANRSIVRSWPMRHTLHITAPEDLRWLVDLVAPRVMAVFKRRMEQLELTPAILAKSCEVFTKALQGNKQITRTGMYELLEQNGISAANQRGIHILWYAAQKGVICFGARDGKQFTFVLFDEWLPGSKTKSHDDAVVELARRYFTGHAPATKQDFAWWSGLVAADVNAAMQVIAHEFTDVTVEGRTYFLPHDFSVQTAKSAEFLPPFDEYLVGYTDRTAAVKHQYLSRLGALLSPTIMIDGQIVGTWTRTLKKGVAAITTKPFKPFTASQQKQIATAAERYGAYLKMEVRL